MPEPRALTFKDIREAKKLGWNYYVHLDKAAKIPADQTEVDWEFMSDGIEIILNVMFGDQVDNLSPHEAFVLFDVCMGLTYAKKAEVKNS